MGGLENWGGRIVNYQRAIKKISEQMACGSLQEHSANCKECRDEEGSHNSSSNLCNSLFQSLFIMKQL